MSVGGIAEGHGHAILVVAGALHKGLGPHLKPHRGILSCVAAMAGISQDIKPSL